MSGYLEITSENCWLNPKDWVNACPSSTIKEGGNNLMHFNTKNTHYSGNATSIQFVQEQLKPQNAKCLKSDTEVLRFAIDRAKELNDNTKNPFLEFGFCTGRSLNFIAALAYDRTVYGFDCGTGLPELWRPGFEKGVFKFNKGVDRMPFCPLDNTTLIIGLIADTIGEFKKKHLNKSKTLAFIHIDTDLYSSATDIYNGLGDFIKPNKTILVLDQGYNYYQIENRKKGDDWKEHEWLATTEFAERKGYEIQYLAYNENHQQLALSFKKVKNV